MELARVNHFFHPLVARPGSSQTPFCFFMCRGLACGSHQHSCGSGPRRGAARCGMYERGIKRHESVRLYLTQWSKWRICWNVVDLEVQVCERMETIVGSRASDKPSLGIQASQGSHQFDDANALIRGLVVNLGSQVGLAGLGWLTGRRVGNPSTAGAFSVICKCSGSLLSTFAWFKLCCLAG